MNFSESSLDTGILDRTHYDNSAGNNLYADSSRQPIQWFERNFMVTLGTEFRILQEQI